MVSDAMQGFIQEIEIRKIRLAKRPLREDAGNVEELASSILEKGLLCPIVVRLLEGGDRFEVVAGNRRLEAFRKLGIPKIQCYISEFDDREAYEASLVENIQRKMLDPLEEAEAFKKYVDEFGYGSTSQLARMINKSPSYVSRRIALLKLPSAVLSGLLRGEKLGMAGELASLNSEGNKKLLTNMILKGKTSDRDEVRRLVKQMNSDEASFEQAHFQPFAHSSEDARQRALDRAFRNYIVSLRVCMMRLDEVLKSLGKDEWVVADTLMQFRGTVHKRIDSLLRLKRKTQHMLPPV